MTLLWATICTVLGFVGLATASEYSEVGMWLHASLARMGAAVNFLIAGALVIFGRRMFGGKR